ncbi:MAG: tRNA modification GTPase [Raineya sp.]|jgi:hypothetical protein|nr:tRNA modification GTPase [Raineya sp.]
MNIYLIALFLFFSCSQISAQIQFEKGYFINNNRDTIHCFIKNLDWKGNPKSFKYRYSDTSKVKTNSIDSVMEFGILDVVKYQRFNVEIDRSSEQINLLSLDKAPIFEKEKLFLKVLIESHANLYYYESGNLRRFFYSTPQEPIKQLIYKSYRTGNNQIAKNTTFKQQLLKSFQCSSINIDDIKLLDYATKPLISLFIKYNNCENTQINNYFQEKKMKFFFEVKTQIRYSKLSIKDELANLVVNFGNKLTASVGFSSEIVLPFNKDRWSIIVEPSFQYFSSVVKNVNDRSYFRPIDIAVNYKSIEIPIGLKHYFHFNKKSKLFLNALYVLDFQLKSKVDFSYYRPDLIVTSGNNFVLGTGFFYNRYSIEARYHFQRQVLSRYMTWNSKYETISVILGYRLKKS